MFLIPSWFSKIVKSGSCRTYGLLLFVEDKKKPIVFIVLFVLFSFCFVFFTSTVFSTPSTCKSWLMMILIAHSSNRCVSCSAKRMTAVACLGCPCKTNVCDDSTNEIPEDPIIQMCLVLQNKWLRPVACLGCPSL